MDKEKFKYQIGFKYEFKNKKIRIEIGDIHFDHIIAKIKEGYTSGELIDDKSCGWWQKLD